MHAWVSLPLMEGVCDAFTDNGFGCSGSGGSGDQQW